MSHRPPQPASLQARLKSTEEAFAGLKMTAMLAADAFLALRSALVVSSYAPPHTLVAMNGERLSAVVDIQPEAGHRSRAICLDGRIE